MTNKQLDSLAKFAVEWAASGRKLEFVIEHPQCPNLACKSQERYQSNPSPSWMNRWTCPKCGRHESR
jgi:transposase-like protein